MARDSNTNKNEDSYFDRTINNWNGELHRAEARLGVVFTGVALSFLLMILGGLYASENVLPLNFGQEYARLSQNPFDFQNPNRLHYRILSPLIGYVLFLRGNLFVILTHGASLVFLVTIYVHFRRKSYEPIEALIFSFMMAFSINVLNEIHFPGTTDPVSYLFLLWAILNIKKPVVWGACFCVALLNHEANFFALPWLVFMALMKNKGSRDRFLGILVGIAACLPWFAVRMVLSRAISSDIPFSAGYYLSFANITRNLEQIFPTLWVGIFSAYKLAWVFPFAAIMIYIRSGKKYNATLLVAIVFCAMAQLFFGWDVTRLMGLGFPAIVLGAEAVREKWGADNFRKWAWRLLFLNLLVPQATTWGDHIITFYPLPYTMLVQYFSGIPL